MSVRDSLNKNPALWLGIIGLLVAIGLVYVLFLREGSNDNVTMPGYYSVDDGQTYFTTNPSGPPPFEHEGQPAVQAIVYKDRETGEMFVPYLRKFREEDHDKVRELEAAGGRGTPVPAMIKKPGDAEWLFEGDPQDAAEIQEIMTVTQSPAGNPVSFPQPE